MEIDKDDKAKKEELHYSTNNPINGDGVINENDNNTPQQRPKKQVRRRHHTSKPYQERLLNMAEARKEIATALKFHRASMKQQQQVANNHHQLQSHPPPQQQTKSNSGRSRPSTATNNHPGPYSALYYPPPPPPSSLHYEDLNLALPNQTLGLNLNFQDFDNLNTRIYTLSSPAAISVATCNEVAASSSGGGLVEPLMKSIEEDGNSGSHEEEDDDGYHHPFEQVMEFPPWLNDTSCFQDHQFSDEYSPDPALPCMDIGEIEGMDGEWLA